MPGSGILCTNVSLRPQLQHLLAGCTVGVYFGLGVMASRGGRGPAGREWPQWEQGWHGIAVWGHHQKSSINLTLSDYDLTGLEGVGNRVCLSSTGPMRLSPCTGPVTRPMGAEHPRCMRCR